MTRPAAADVLQQHLDTVAGTVMRRDFDAYCAHVCLPMQVVTDDATMVFTDREAMRGMFERFADTLRGQQVTDFLRLADAASYLDERLICGRYTTHLVAGALRLLPPYGSAITLRCDGGQWRATSLVHSLSTLRWPLILAAPDPDFMSKGP